MYAVVPTTCRSQARAGSIRVPTSDGLSGEAMSSTVSPLSAPATYAVVPTTLTADAPATVAVAEEAPRITADQLAEVFAGTEVFLLDVRRPDELEELGTVEGYTNIPIGELADRLDELPRDRPILTA